MEPIASHPQLPTTSHTVPHPAANAMPSSGTNRVDGNRTMPEQPAVSEKSIQQAVEQANQQTNASNSESVSFNYEPEINRMVVQVKDNATGKVIREIPSKDFVKQQVAIREMIGLILDKHA